MPKSPSPWSVKGVDPEAREAAKIAARRAGMTVGAWLSQIIRQSASEQLRGGSRAALQHTPDTPHHSARSYPNTGDRAGYDSGAGDCGSRPYPPQEPAAPGTSPPPAPTMEAIFESIQRLSSRIEQSEKRTADTIAPIARKISALNDRLERTKDADGISTAPVERAMQRISERLDRIEQRRTAPSQAVQTSREDEPRGLFGLFRKDR